MKRTEWFPARIKPVREGLYEVYTPDWPAHKFSYWNGNYFELCSDQQRRFNSDFCRLQSVAMKGRGSKWRGLTCEGGEE